MTAPDLRPCPFCGSKAYHKKVDPAGYIQMECDRCWAEGPTAEDIVAAVAAWNKREGEGK